MSHRITTWLVCLFMVLGPIAPVALATDYYVTNNGAPTGGDGTVGLPFGTITEALTNAPLVAGDRLFIGPGTYDAVGGEVYPLAPPVPMEMIGAGGGTTILAYTSFAGVDILNSFVAGSNYAFRDLFFSGTGGNEALELSADGGSGTLLIEDCTFFACGGVEVWWETSGVHRLEIRDCDFISGSFDQISVEGSGWPATAPFAMEVLIEGNNFYGMTNGTALECTAYTLSNAVITVRDNVLSSMESGFSFYIAGYTVNMNAQIDIESNCMSGISYSGIRMDAFGDRALLNLDLSIARNEMNAAYRGLSLELSGDDGLSSVTATNLLADVVIASNAVRSCTAGMELEIDARGLALVRGCMSLRNNLIQNCEIGISLTAFEATGLSSGLVLMDFDLGGQGNCGPDNPPGGLNTFDGNTVMNLVVDLDPHIDVPAVANFWGTRNLGVIEAGVYHALDDPFLAMVDYSKPLPSGINMRATPRKVFQAGGQTVTVRALNTGFVQRCGCDEILVTLDGIPMSNVQVAPNGRTLTFDVPPMPNLGAVALEITNPGGQVGAFLMGVKP